MTLADSSWSSGAWAPDDTIIYTPNYTSGLWRVASSGGTPRKLTDPNTADGELGHFFPQMLPDGTHVLFTSFRTPADRSRIEVYSLEDGTRTVVMDGGFFGQYATSGHLLFARSTTVMAVRFDASRPATLGQAVPVIADVAATLPNGLSQFSLSNNGTLTYLTQATLTAPSQLVWIDRTGPPSPIGDVQRRFEEPRISPDGRLVALTIRDENDADIWTYDLARGTLSRITSAPTTQFRPVWSPDSRRLYFVFEEPVFHIYSHTVDGSTAAPTRVVDGPYDVVPMAVTPDGRTLVYQRNDPQTRGGIWVLDLNTSMSRVLIDTPADESDGALSPDGRWLAFRSDETGRPEIYVQSFPNGENRVRVSLNGGRVPRWSGNSRQLFYQEIETLMSATLEGSTFGRPTKRFEGRLGSYDVAADGRVLGVLRDPNLPQAPLNIVVNWFEELKRLVPAK